MKTIELPWETWRAIIAALRGKALPSMLEHTDRLEQQLEEHPPVQATVTLHLTDDLFLRSYNCALAAGDSAATVIAPDRLFGVMGVRCALAAPQPTLATRRHPGAWPPPPRFSRDFGGPWHGQRTL